MAKQDHSRRCREHAAGGTGSLSGLLPAIQDRLRIWRTSSAGTVAGAHTVRPRRLAAFTLMEVMISSVIMAFVLVSILSVISRSNRYLMDLRMHARSSQILQQRVEELRSMSWNEITNLPTTFTSSSDTNGQYGKTLNISNYQLFGTTATVVRATIVATWTNRQSKVVTNTLSTLISNGGVNKTSL